MTIKNDSTIKPWMEELWAWADKLELCDDTIPRNVKDLLAMTYLSAVTQNLGNSREIALPIRLAINFYS